MTEFAKKYRPKQPSELAGEQQRKIAQSLLDDLEKGEVAQKLMFFGSSGTGKTTIGRMYIEALLKKPYDECSVIQVNCIEDSGVAFVREQILKQLNHTSLFSDYVIFFLDEIHGWSGKAQEGLLIDLEDLPEHVIIVACSTRPDKINSTLSSRFSSEIHYLTFPSVNELKPIMRNIFAQEELEVNEKIGMSMIENCKGNVRTLVGYIEQYKKGTYNPIQESEIAESFVKALLANKPFPQLLKIEIGDYNGACVAICSYCLVVMKSGKDGNFGKAFDIFSEGLNDNMPPKIAFYRLVRRYLK